ncbi:TetR family transcriptional regulator [Streptomyces sp. NPDC093991]|uniref:TetR family transcriptional regulator n=1 Tax=unclassified Streptomyces TaxID=2593676 RepID=UPI003438DB67
MAVGRRLFADRPCDAPSMDDIARRARVAEGLIPCCFHSERGCCPAITEDSAAGPVAPAASGDELPPVERVRRTVDSCLRYAEHHRAARRAIGGMAPGVSSWRRGEPRCLT